MRAHCLFVAAILLVPSPVVFAADLSQETLKAWDQYIQETDSRMQQRLTGASPFLWIDEAPGRRAQVHEGEILVAPANEESPRKVPEGLIHDWLGAMFIPDATAESVFATLDDYCDYNRFYPAVIDAKPLDAEGATRRYSMLLAEKFPLLTAAIASEYSSRTIQVDPHRWYTITYSTRIQQIVDYGKPEQHELPPDQGTGYLWRVFSIERFEERDGGVYTELEVIALSRNIPFGFRWLVDPIVRHLPRHSMQATLEKTREAIRAPEDSKTLEAGKLSPEADNHAVCPAKSPNQLSLDTNSARPLAKSFGMFAGN